MSQEEIGKTIKKIRINNNLSQDEFAEKLGVTRQAVSKWENGRGIPDISLLKLMSSIFKVDLCCIINGENCPDCVSNKDEEEDPKYYRLVFFLLGIIILLILILYIIILTKK